MQNMMIRFTVLITLLFPSLSSAVVVNNIFVFGDSLSDGGNVYNVTGGFFPPSPYAQRFSNGPVAVEQFAKLAGVTLTPSTTGGNNYAYGGAATGVVAGTVNTDNYLSESVPLPFLNGTGIQNQVDQFIASGKGFDSNQSLFVVWGGPNDIFTWLDGYAAATIDEVIAGAVTNIFNSISALAAKGAENFLIPNMVDLGMTPFGIKQGTSAQFGLTQISNAFNAFLDQSLDAIVGANIFGPMLTTCYNWFRQIREPTDLIM
jgi:phospholipase/lecithinase/hemolysin